MTRPSGALPTRAALTMASLALALAAPGCAYRRHAVAAPQAAAEGASEAVFADPQRRAKLAAAFPEIDALVTSEQATHHLAGIAVGVVIDGELAHFVGRGAADLQTKAPPTADTVFRIASITKSFTALATLALADDGVVALDDPLADYIPEAAKLVAPTSDGPAITLRHLMLHRAGLPRSGPYENAGVAQPSEEMVVRSLVGSPLESTPGSRHMYSNMGYQLLGIAVGRASGVGLRQLMQRRIFEPLGMSSTSFDGEGRPAGQLAIGYDRDPKGVQHPVPVGRHGAIEGAGGIISSVRDMARYVAFHLAAYPPRSAPDDGPVRRGTMRDAHASALRGSRLDVQLREGAAKGEAMVNARMITYAYGLGVIESCDFDQLYTHNGGLPGYSSAIAFLPSRGVGVVALTNQGQGGRDPSALTEAILQALQRTGGLATRTPKPTLSGPLEAAMTRLLGVYTTWDAHAYHLMLSPERGVVTEDDERAELAGYKAFHGACTGFTPIEAKTPREARIAVRCERGAFEMAISIDPRGLILGFSGVSRDVTPPPAVAAASAKLLGLVRTWDEAVHDALFAPEATEAETTRKRAERAASFADLRARHGACTLRSYARTNEGHELRLACDRGREVRVELHLAEDAVHVARWSASDVPLGGACPVK